MIYSHEYQIFQKISKLDYEIPSGFNASAQDLVRKLLVLSMHNYFKPIVWRSDHLLSILIDRHTI